MDHGGFYEKGATRKETTDTSLQTSKARWT
jgi:hypothetical protein